MTLREQIAQIRCLHCEEYSHHKQSCLITPNVVRFCPEALGIADQIHAIYKENNYVRLSDDQSLPKNPYIPYSPESFPKGESNTITRGCQIGYNKAQQDMKDNDFRRVELNENTKD